MADIDYSTSSFDDLCAWMQASLDRNAAALKRLGIDLDAVQTESEKQMQAPKFEADRLAYIMGRSASDRSLEDTRFLNAFPEERRAFIMQNGTAEPVDQRFLASTIISEMKSLDEASRTETSDVEKDRLAQDIGKWMKGDAVKPGEVDIESIKPGLNEDDSKSIGMAAAGAILKALRGN